MSNEPILKIKICHSKIIIVLFLLQLFISGKFLNYIIMKQQGPKPWYCHLFNLQAQYDEG